ncbi:3,4-dihydroxy-2-butanone-4-phosphate synthase [Kurthia sibirica]|uniref:3,4-dihydroxy-2-butanone 4-phosphate synthase n=1 Tax=Kurthia sibirica TaxID=202750 RepID=A0A2U3ANB4_9BACL|nr:3,4-dihydroxy-2-butanone-4-phosphate synthase [Kurthia sibirica]PWI26033.1 3,4-dihydroxy-2-butanone-4-phosphate synthase [Kurthia sibirica]GEK34566.1 hypothetical protein KSI01_20990 [Kurthia sibirica]
MTIEAAINDLKQGKMIIVTDDIGRENEGDLVALAEFATTDTIAFMAKEGRGLICTPVSAQIAHHLNLHPMVEKNTDNHGTAFTVSIDHINTTTGISAADRLLTIQALMQPHNAADHFRRPGHVFPLIANAGGVAARAGHTEAAIDFAKLCKAQEVAIICEIMGDDGIMLAGDSLALYAQSHNLTTVTIIELTAFLTITKIEMGK